MNISVRHQHRIRSTPAAPTLDLPPVLYSEQGRNITSLLGETVLLKCTVLGYKQEVHTVSWTRTTRRNKNPTALTFGSQVTRLLLFNLAKATILGDSVLSPWNNLFGDCINVLSQTGTKPALY